jgi:hypothetical protein
LTFWSPKPLPGWHVGEFPAPKKFGPNFELLALATPAVAANVPAANTDASAGRFKFRLIKIPPS